jgi:luciferase family oxidoreductase group 1
LASPRISILDLAAVGRAETIADSFAGSVALARLAEQLGYRRVWYAEHHNIPTIASSATAVPIAHVAAHTERIRLGSGGIMLPNHSPLVIAEQFGTLAALHPGRIDLGLGRAPGTHQTTWRALRRDLTASECFPDDVLELRGGRHRCRRPPTARDHPAHPGAQPVRSERPPPHRRGGRSPPAVAAGRPRRPDAHVHTAVGEPSAVRTYLEEFRDHTAADELITVHHGENVATRLHSVELLAEAMGLER